MAPLGMVIIIPRKTKVGSVPIVAQRSLKNSQRRERKNDHDQLLAERQNRCSVREFNDMTLGKFG